MCGLFFAGICKALFLLSYLLSEKYEDKYLILTNPWIIEKDENQYSCNENISKNSYKKSSLLELLLREGFIGTILSSFFFHYLFILHNYYIVLFCFVSYLKVLKILETKLFKMEEGIKDNKDLSKSGIKRKGKGSRRKLLLNVEYTSNANNLSRLISSVFKLNLLCILFFFY
jgi:hypothetical protein